jgi:hypothetical protein
LVSLTGGTLKIKASSTPPKEWKVWKVNYNFSGIFLDS